MKSAMAIVDGGGDGSEANNRAAKAAEEAQRVSDAQATEIEAFDIYAQELRLQRLKLTGDLSEIEEAHREKKLLKLEEYLNKLRDTSIDEVEIARRKSEALADIDAIASAKKADADTKEHEGHAKKTSAFFRRSLQAGAANSKTIAKANRLAAIAQGGLDVAQGVMSAWKWGSQFGTPFAIAAAAAAAVTGAGLLSNIKSGGGAGAVSTASPGSAAAAAAQQVQLAVAITAPEGFGVTVRAQGGADQIETIIEESRALTDGSNYPLAGGIGAAA